MPASWPLYETPLYKTAHRKPFARFETPAPFRAKWVWVGVRKTRQPGALEHFLFPPKRGNAPVAFLAGGASLELPHGVPPPVG